MDRHAVRFHRLLRAVQGLGRLTHAQPRADQRHHPQLLGRQALSGQRPKIRAAVFTLGHAISDARSFEARDAQFDLLRQQLAWRRNQDAQQDIGTAIEVGGKLGQKTDAIAARSGTSATSSTGSGSSIVRYPRKVTSVRPAPSIT